MDVWLVIAAVAIILTAVQIFPQVIKSFRTKKVRDVSLWMIVIIILGAFVWLVYGLHIQSIPIILANLLNFVMALTLLYMKLRY